jgi:hypothetical protein
MTKQKPITIHSATVRGMYFQLDSHLNPYGNQILAHVVEDYLLQNQLLLGAQN